MSNYLGARLCLAWLPPAAGLPGGGCRDECVVTDRICAILCTKPQRILSPNDDRDSHFLWCRNVASC